MPDQNDAYIVGQFVEVQDRLELLGYLVNLDSGVFRITKSSKIDDSGVNFRTIAELQAFCAGVETATM